MELDAGPPSFQWVRLQTNVGTTAEVTLGQALMPPPMVLRYRGEERDALYPKRLIRTSPLQAGFGSCALWRWVAGVFSKPVGLSSCPGEGHRGHKSHGKDKVHDSWSQAILGTSHFTVQVEWGPEFYYKQPEIQSSGCPSTKYFIIPLKI